MSASQVYGALERADDPLLPTSSKVIEDKPSLVKRVAGTALVVALLAGVGVVYSTNSSSAAQQALSSSLNSKPVITVLNEGSEEQHGWYVYKLAFIGASEMREQIWHFMDTYLEGSSSEQVPLGCDGYKLNVQLGSSDDRQFHYVTAPNLPSSYEGMDANAWIKLQMDDLGDMSEFSTFIHDKATLFVGDIQGKFEALKEDGYSIMRRQSTDTEGQLIGHALVPVGGKVWEFVGSLTDMTTDEATSAGWTAWAEEECPAAHAVKHAASELQADYESKGSALFIALSNAVSSVDSSDFHLMLDHIHTITSPTTVLSQNDYCSMISMTWSNEESDETGGATGSDVELRYVHNFKYDSLKTGETVEEFQDYVYNVHEEYLKPVEDNVEVRWRNWDHWLDFHVGLKYRSSEGCLDSAKFVTNTLTEAHIPVGKRMVAADGDHYYSGYKGSSMCVEYNTECHFGTGTSNICACSGMNSYFLSSAENIVDAVCEAVHESDVETSGRPEGELKDMDGPPAKEPSDPPAQEN